VLLLVPEQPVPVDKRGQHRGQEAHQDERYVLSLLALSVSTQIVGGSFSYTVIGIVLAKSVAFLVVAALFGIYGVSRFMERLDTTGFAKRYPEFLFIFAMMMAFLYAVMAELTGLSAIVGAFIAGVSFEGVRFSHGHDLKQGAEYLQIIFASIFFVSARRPC